jgi:Family of unknown function (DUF5990)
MRIRIEASELPGRAPRSFEGRRSVVVGVQRRGRPAEILDPQPWDADAAEWEFEGTVDPEQLDLRGPYVEGRPGERFVYLSWGTVHGDRFDMFRRAKLMLADVPDEVLRDAVAAGRLVARLGLTDAKGGPLCAAVRPPVVRWSAG